jgi:putative membrane protein
VLSSVPQLAPVKEQLDGAVQFAQGLQAYMDGVAQLGRGASELTKGISEFRSSTATIQSSANELYKAGAELNQALKKLRDGLASYKEGTEELRKGTSDMDSEIQNKLDEMLEQMTGKGEKTVSFVSEKNTNVSSVQFVLKTAAIRLPEEAKSPDSKTDEPNFWQKLLSLFGRSESSQ